MTDRCPTGIIGFDKATQGGLVRNSSNVLIGGPGSGKTTFLLQFLYNGAEKFNENGLYCSFEPDIIETLKDGLSYGWDFSKLNEQDKVKFLKFSPKTSVNELKSEIAKLISKHHIKRICFDPVSVLAMTKEDESKIRESIFDLVSLMKRFKVTTLLADESVETESIDGTEITPWSRADIIKFLSDSVTVLYESGIQGISDRTVKITKMRRTNHVRKNLPMEITDEGIKIKELPEKQTNDVTPF